MKIYILVSYFGIFMKENEYMYMYFTLERSAALSTLF